MLVHRAAWPLLLLQPLQFVIVPSEKKGLNKVVQRVQVGQARLLRGKQEDECHDPVH